MSKNVIIIGGTKGIGLETARLFLDLGKTVHIIARSTTDKSTSNLVQEWKKKLFVYSCDASKNSDLLEARTEIIKNSKNQVDVLICCAGNGNGSSSAFQSSEEWDMSWKTNFETAQNSTSTFFKDLIKTKGNIIYISSIAGLENIGAPVSYSVAKSALVSYAKMLSSKLAPEIRVNVVAPGNIFSPGGTWDLKLKKNPIEVNKMLEQKVPLKRMGKPEEVAELIVFLSSKKASFITGSCFVIDGGQTINF